MVAGLSRVIKGSSGAVWLCGCPIGDPSSAFGLSFMRCSILLQSFMQCI